MRSRALLPIGGVVGSLLIAVAAIAQGVPGCGVAAPPSEAMLAAGTANVAIILDASNSMNRGFGEGTRLSVAKEALLGLFDVLPLGLNVRLSVYGHRVPKTEREESCVDLQRVFGPEPFTDDARGQLAVLLDGITAMGLTPLEEALLRAGQDLSELEGASVIVLLSDGEETCDGDPLAAAALLASFSPPIVVHVVGLDLEPEARDTLVAIAELTGGEYVGAREAADVLAGLFSLLAPGLIDEADTGPAIPPEFACLGITNVIVGTDDKDTLIGTEGNDLIYGLGGNDLIVGLGGNDVLLGGPGNDVIEGGEGCDFLSGDGGNDVLFGGGGDDLLCGGPGCDSMEGEAGNDRLNGGPDDDYLLGGDGDDVLDSGGGSDLLLEGRQGTVACVPCTVPCLPICPLPQPPCAPDPGCPLPCPPPVNPCGDKSVDEGCSIQLHGTVTDHDCNVVSVIWQADKGAFDDPTSLDPIYYAPMTPYCQGEDVCISLVATDSCGATGRDAFTLHINNVNRPPVADAGEDIVIDEGTAVQLTCGAFDPDGDALCYYWTAACGAGSFSDPTQLHPCYTAPLTDLCEGEAIVLTLTVTDACGAQASDTMVAYVRNRNNQPTADAGEDLCVDEGATVQLTCSAYDPDGDALAYCWTVEGGKGVFDDPTLLHPRFTAPPTDRCEGEDIVLTLAVTDACGARACDTMIIHVRDVNLPPIVELGPGLCVNECASLCLSAVASDPECAVLQYWWTASRGSFSDPTASSPVYYAPETSQCEGEDVTITLTVTDPCGLSACDTMTVRIMNVNNPPVVKADP